MIIESSQLPEGTKVYLKQDFLGWRIVHPIRNEDGSMNSANLLFGGKRNLAFLLIILIIMSIAYLGYKEMESNYKQVVDDPCSFCKNCQMHTNSILKQAYAKYNPADVFDYSGIPIQEL